MRYLFVLCVLFSLAACSSGGSSGDPGQPIQLPKTGQVASYKAGDNGALQKGVAWPAPRFVDNGNGTVTDKLTGLLWLKDANCIGKKNWPDALAAANGLATGVCGLSDGSKAGNWRLPNITELNSLVNVGLWNPAVGPLAVDGNPEALLFSMTANAYYWSSTTSATVTYHAWAVHFLFGQLNPVSKKNTFSVWPVRDAAAPGVVRLARTGQNVSYAAGDDGYHQKGAVWPNPRFTDNGNGTITDNLTRLVWLKDANCLDEAGGIKRNKPSTTTESSTFVSSTFSILSYYEALSWVNGLKSGICGLSDSSREGSWRLPNRLEMQSLTDYSSFNPALPAGHPFVNIQPQGAWTSSVLSYSNFTGGGDSSWFIYPESGITNAMTNNHLTQYYLWAVREHER